MSRKDDLEQLIRDNDAARRKVMGNYLRRANELQQQLDEELRSPTPEQVEQIPEPSSAVHEPVAAEAVLLAPLEQLEQPEPAPALEPEPDATELPPPPALPNDAAMLEALTPEPIDPASVDQTREGA